jgi:hypothetical protein
MRVYRVGPHSLWDLDWAVQRGRRPHRADLHPVPGGPSGPAGRCFRLVAHRGEAGPSHCPEPVAWRGSWRAPNGRRYRIEACEGHRPAAIEGSSPST